MNLNKSDETKEINIYVQDLRRTLSVLLFAFFVGLMIIYGVVVVVFSDSLHAIYALAIMIAALTLITFVVLYFLTESLRVANAKLSAIEEDMRDKR